MEERLTSAQWRLTRAEASAQQALQQVRQLETSVKSLQVEEQPAFQSLSRQVRHIAKGPSRPASLESLTELQQVVYGLERRLCELTWQPAGPRSSEPHGDGVMKQQEEVLEGLHFADGTVESIRPRNRAPSPLK